MKRFIATYKGFVAVSVFALTAACCSLGPSSLPTTQTQVGSIGKITSADIASWLKQGRGKIVVLNFWATWCPPCVAEMPEIASFYKGYPRDQVDLYAISLDASDEITTTVEPFIKQRQLPFPVSVLVERDIETLSKTIGVEISGVLPTTIIYDPSGKPVRVWEEAVTREDLDTAVQTILQ